MMDMEREDFIFLEALNRHGTVFLVRQNSTGRILVARKMAADQTGVFETLRTIDSGHIPAIRAIEPQPDGTVLIYEDYIQGVTLRKVLDDRQPRLEKSDAVEIARQLCRALAPVHAAGIVHRDIKPENIILGVDSQVYLIDFGIARVEKAGRSADTEFLGTQGYAAPEQFGFCQSDARADIYALGVVINQIVTGSFPNEAQTDGLLGEIVARCINLDPQQRYASVRELDAALAALPRSPRPAYCKPQKKRIAFPYPLCLVPGFRSGTPEKALFAVAAVFWFFIFAAAGFSSAANDPVDLVIVVGMLTIPVGAYVIGFDLFNIQRHVPLLNKVRGTYTHRALTAFTVALWSVAVFLLTGVVAAAVKAVIR